MTRKKQCSQCEARNTLFQEHEGKLYCIYCQGLVKNQPEAPPLKMDTLDGRMNWKHDSPTEGIPYSFIQDRSRTRHKQMIALI